MVLGLDGVLVGLLVLAVLVASQGVTAGKEQLAYFFCHPEREALVCC